jgi:hypothetical protein
MRIRFLRDYRGTHTDEEFYLAGAEADLPTGQAIVDEGAAEIAVIVERRGQVTPAAPILPPSAPPSHVRGRKGR